MTRLTNTSSPFTEFSDRHLEGALQELIAPELELVSRAPNPYVSSHPIEDVSVSVGNDLLDLFCKYSPTRIDSVTGHRRGALYEGSIYERVFPDREMSTPRLYGTFQLDDDVHCIVLESVSGYRIDHSIYPRGLVEACHDLGRFHSRGVRSLRAGHNLFNRHHFSLLISEAERLPGVAARMRGAGSTLVDVLSNAPRTIIHGELYPKNILINELGIVVTDWESAGVGPGVIDLAVLTQGSWDPDLVEESEEAYWRARGDRISTVSRRYLAAARIFAAGQLLLHLTAKENDGVQEEIALETIASHTPLLTG